MSAAGGSKGGSEEFLQEEDQTRKIEWNAFIAHPETGWLSAVRVDDGVVGAAEVELEGISPLILPGGRPVPGRNAPCETLVRLDTACNVWARDADEMMRKQPD